MFCTFSSNFNSEDIPWLSSLQTLLTNLNFHIAKYFSVILFAVPLSYQTHSQRDEIFSNGNERDEKIQQWTNYSSDQKKVPVFIPYYGRATVHRLNLNGEKNGPARSVLRS